MRVAPLRTLSEKVYTFSVRTRYLPHWKTRFFWFTGEALCLWLQTGLFNVMPVDKHWLYKVAVYSVARHFIYLCLLTSLRAGRFKYSEGLTWYPTSLTEFAWASALKTCYRLIWYGISFIPLCAAAYLESIVGKESPNKTLMPLLSSSTFRYTLSF